MLRTIAVNAEWKLQPGKKILEIKPDGRDKGTAILEYMAEPPFAGRLPVFVGDDLTDEYGFVAATHLGGWAVKVGRGQTRAHYRLRDVAAVRGWLADVASASAFSSVKAPAIPPRRRTKEPNAQPRTRADR